MKKYLIIYYGDAPECVEGFSKECARMKKGALHIKPGRQMTVTGDELKHIKTDKKCAHIVPKLRILGEKKDAPKNKEEASNSSKSESKDESKKDKSEDKTQEEGTASGKVTKKKVTKKTGRS